MHTILLLAGAVISTVGYSNVFNTSFTLNCKENEFLCRNLQCIPKSKRCDNKMDCSDHSDEENCEMLLCKQPKYFRCKNSRCISTDFVCNGENDCEDFSDEMDCKNIDQQVNANTSCASDEWQCTNKFCIPIELVCNDEIDCMDGSDEIIGCSPTIQCDGFKCKNNHCIVKEWRCDGSNDCHDNSDEEGCETQVDPKVCTWDNQRFLCNDNKTCIQLDQVCDGTPQCPDKSDESPLCKSTNNSCSTRYCSHSCIQLPTGPKCVCPTGYYTINEKHCQDINECEIYGICDQKCRNKPGKYECYCDQNYTLQHDKKTCKTMMGDAIMLFSSKNEIRAYLIEADLYFPVATNLKQVVGVHFNGHHVYWTDIFSEHESIVRSLKDGSQRELLVTSGLGAPEDLDIDWVTGNIYFTDAERQHIGVCTDDGTHCTVLVNKDIHKPRGIVLHPEEGEMFWTDWGKRPEIARALMDGSKDISFVANDIHWPNGLAIDFPNERLYWTDAKVMTLESIRLDGTDRRIILEGIVKHPYAIAVFENRLYWSDWATHSIQSCDKFTGKNHHTLIKEKKHHIYGIHIYHPTLYKRRNDNPCSSAFCSDICLLSGTSYTCACPQDKELSLDGHTCKQISKKQMLILGADNMLIHVEHQLLGKHEVSALPVLVKNVGAFAYDNSKNILYISDTEAHKIITLNLYTGVAKPLALNNLGKVIAMDYDYMTNNLYWCDEQKSSVEVLNLNTMSRKILLHDMHGEVPESIALVPEEGIMFVALKRRNKRETHVDRLFMDGSARIHSIEYGLLGPVVLLYDSDLKRIFLSDAGTGNIESTSIEGDDRHGFRSLQTSPVGIASLKSDIFWVNENSRRLYWANKLNPENSYNKKITLDIPEDIKKMNIISITPKKTGSSYCQHNNGNCSHLCLLSQKNIVCACPTGMILQHNNQTCSKRIECDPDEFFCSKSLTCISNKLLCNGEKDCEFNEDEEGCKKLNHCPQDHFQCQDGECIKEVLICDSKYDCKDKSDEHNCSHLEFKPCPPNHFKCTNGQCITERFVCDGSKNCENGEDEEDCSSNTCGPSQFRCLSGSCIPKKWECDHEYDCPDFSDEHFQCNTCLSGMFTCSNGKCIDKHFVCDNEDDCGDNSDETSCEVLVNICNPGEFSCSSNAVICLPNNARCNGTSECPHHEDEQNCSDCHVEEFTCDNKRCIPTQWLCDSTNDCGDNSDEAPSLCLHAPNFSISKLQVPCEEGFRCKSGHCVDLSLVCNGKPDCYDGSDEGGVCQSSCDGINSPCSHLCVKTPSGPMCKCRPGYKLLGDGYNCQDINECQNNPPVCSQLCINNLGSYTCDCYEGFILRPDKISCKAEGEAMSLIFTMDDQIRELSQSENTLKLVYSEDTPKITGLGVTIKSNYIYYSIETSGTIHRINTKTKKREYIDHIGQPQKLAIDWITNNIYFVNANYLSKSISLCNFDDKICSKLITIDVHRQASAIAVDAVNKVLFYSLISWWMFNSPSYVIYKTNLDGTGAQEMVKSTAGYITGLSYDLHKKQLFYVDQHQGHLYKINYDGTMNTLLASNLTRPVGLGFFENHVYYLTTGGFMGKCKLYEPSTCINFKLHSYSTELFAISQESCQPSIKNVCQNHTCSHLCVPTQLHYKCLCEDGKLIAPTDKCSDRERESLLDGRTSFELAKQTLNNLKENNGPMTIIILIPICILAFGVVAFYLIKKRNSGSLNIGTIRFHNPTYDLYNDEGEKSILQPNQHEYTNPVSFQESAADINKSNLLVDV